jgi:cytoskeleton protein RodZ
MTLKNEVTHMAEHTYSDPDAKPNGAVGGEDKGGLGEILRKQRKARGISLVEVAEHTKIGKKYLEALENEDYTVLPAETYTLGFLRAYARYLEMDDDDLIRHYREQRRLLHATAEPGSEVGGIKTEGNQSLWAPLLLVLVLAGLGAGLFLLWPSGKAKPEAKSGAEEMAGGEMPASLGAGVPATSDLTLKIRAKEKTWITLMIDGRQEPDVILDGNEERTWTAKDRFVLWTGNAGGIEVTFNGEPQPPLGEKGEVRKEVVFERKTSTPVVVPALQ